MRFVCKPSATKYRLSSLVSMLKLNDYIVGVRSAVGILLGVTPSSAAVCVPSLGSLLACLLVRVCVL